MKFFAILALGMFGTSAFAQTCYVDLVQKPYNRVIRTFVSSGDSSCMIGMRDCRKSIRLDYSNNPQYPNNSLDCISANRQTNPAPNPYPQPNPYPNPAPNPYPQPNPYPDYGSIEGKVFASELTAYVTTYEGKYRLFKVLATAVNDLSLNRLLETCNTLSTWQGTSNCVTDGIRYMPNFYLNTSEARTIALNGCAYTATYSDEARCLEASARYFPSLSAYTYACLAAGYNSSSASCLKNIIRNYL